VGHPGDRLHYVKRRRRSGWQESNVIQWVHTNGQTKAFTAVIDPEGKKASGAGTESILTTHGTQDRIFAVGKQH
jgi:hypothetical protein